jgi:hypothetical protein
MCLVGLHYPQKWRIKMKHRSFILLVLVSILFLGIAGTTPPIHAADVGASVKLFNCSPSKAGSRYFVKCRATNYWNISSAGPDLFGFYVEGPAALFFVGKSLIRNCVFLQRYKFAHCPGDKYLEGFL